MAESLGCSPETVTTALIVYTPIQNKKVKQLACSRQISFLASLRWLSWAAGLLTVFKHRLQTVCCQ